MDVPSFMGCKPTLDVRVLVGGIVVNHDMHFKFLRNIVFDMFEERQILLMPVSSLTLSKHLAVGNVECSKEGCRTMSLIVVSNAFNVSEAHRQHWLSVFQCLDLALFIDTQHDGILRRTQVEPYNIADFFHKERIS